MDSETTQTFPPQAPDGALDPQRLEAFMNKMVGDMGVAVSGALVVLGDRLGLYKAMAAQGPMTSAELAAATGTSERYVREWLSAQAAADYVTFNADTQKFFLTPEQALVFANEEAPTFMAGGFEILQAMWRDEPKIEAAFQSGEGVGWHEHDACLFRGTERFFRPGYNTNLIASWIPALDGVKDKLERGANVADVGCGHGTSTILMAQAFPKSHFTGFDYHGPSIERAKEAAEKAGVADRVTFERASASDFPERKYDLVAMFDCLHDMGDPVGAGKHVKESLAKDGTWMIVEPVAGDRVEENLTPVGRTYYGFSALLCTPSSLAQPGAAALGTQAGPARIREITEAAGFTGFRLAAQTPFNNVFAVTV